MQAEAASVAAGWPRMQWLAGGLWLVLREANVLRKIVYWTGIAAITLTTAWVIWQSWRTVPSADGEALTDRFRILVGAVALAGLPWLGRRRGLFGPVGNTITARLMRLTGCALLCGLGVAIVRIDSHAGHNGFGSSTFSWLQEIVCLMLLVLVLTVPPVVRSRWPQIESSTLWCVIAMATATLLVVLPAQTFVVLYIAGILAATSRSSRVSHASLRVGAITGAALAASTYGLLALLSGLSTFNVLASLAILAANISLTAAAAGAATAWLLAQAETTQVPRAALVRQGLFAGLVAGATSGLILSCISAGLVFFSVFNLLASVGGMVGAALMADHWQMLRANRSWTGGLFVLMRHGRPVAASDN